MQLINSSNSPYAEKIEITAEDCNTHIILISTINNCCPFDPKISEILNKG